MSARLLRKIKREPNSATRNGSLIRSIDTVFPGDEIVICTVDEVSDIAANPRLCVEIVYEDDDMIIFNKPPFMAVHPSHRHRDDTLANYFAYCCPGRTFRAVNRLDRDTSGACVAAKNQYSAARLQGNISKIYYAAAEGVTPESGTIDMPIKREQESIIKRCVSSDGERAVTHYERICTNGELSLLKIWLETGRTHQIRVHFAAIGFPLAGDDMYGGSRKYINRQALHCRDIYIDNKVYTAKMYEDMKSLEKMIMR